MNYLLDVHVLLAWGWSDHVDHDRTVAWIAAAARRKGTRLLTSAIPQLGFVRVSVQRSSGRVTVSDAARVLEGMLATLGARHQLLPDDLAARRFPAWCGSASRTTDAHLLELATRNGAALATLDAGIPGAFVVPG